MPAAPVAPFADPPAVGEPDAAPNPDAGEGDDKEDVGTLRGSDPTAVWPLFGLLVV